MKTLMGALLAVLGLVVLPIGLFFLWQRHKKSAIADQAVQAQQAEAARLAASNAQAGHNQSGNGGGVDTNQLLANVTNGAFGLLASAADSYFSS